MAFVNEFPSEEDINKYNLTNYKNDKNLSPEFRSIWTVDHGRNFHLWGGLSGKPQFDEVIKGKFYLYLNGSQFFVILTPGKSSLAFSDNPYRVKWDAVEAIFVIRPGCKDGLPNSAWKNPHASQPVLDGKTLNSFLQILKEALSVHGEGDANRNIHNPIDVQFGF
jgi:hypothetical protein